MDQETIKKVELSIEKLRDKTSRIYLMVQDTKGNAKASIRYTYQMAMTLKNNGFNPIILHESNDYSGVGSWMGEEYMEITHQSIEGQNLQITPEDFVIIPELYGHVMDQIKELPCGKIVLCQAYDYMLETIQPGMNWSSYGFLKCITTSDTQKEFISSIMKNTTLDVITPLIPEIFTKKTIPAKPIISIHTRDQRDTMKIIKAFYLKYPQFRWITFRDMRGLNQEEFATNLQESFVSVWVDDISGLGTYPLESMACGTPVIGKVPNMKPEWMSDTNGVWTYELNNMSDIVAEYTQNWLEDNISEGLYESGYETVSKYQQTEEFETQVVSMFTSYLNTRMESFQSQIDKLKLEETE
tara:strand:+ start:11630 stop:12694 length:1065 start_codon:yes stop_codon:yes gene_type:complete